MLERRYHISQEFTAACHLLDIDPDQVLVRLGWPKTVLQAADGGLTAGQVTQVFGVIVTEYGQDDFHIKLAEGFAKAPFGHAFLALQCSETLREGIHNVARFKPFIEPVDWTVSESETALRLTLKSLSEAFPFGGISQIMSFLWLIKSCRNVTAKHLAPTRVMITDDVPHQAAIEQDLGCPIEIAGHARMDLPMAAMSYSILSSNRFVISGLDMGVNKARQSDDSFVSAVYAIVLELLPSGVVTLERAARRLAVGKRTLERRLSDQAFSFSDIVRNCRRDMARHYLCHTPLPLAEVGLLLGYREPNSFYRAFREWYGCSPQEYRSKMVA